MTPAVLSTGKNWYAVVVAGKNAHIAIDGKIGVFGFYTTRYVKDSSSPNAAAQALALVKRELNDILKNPPGDDPSLSVDSISKKALGWLKRRPNKGFTWYPEDESFFDE